MSNILFVGDPHVQKTNLEESERLMKWIVTVAQAHNAQILLAGDLYNDFAVKRVEVEEFWNRHLRAMGRPIVLTGNHDMNSDCSSSALTVHRDQCALLVDGPMKINDVGFLPFIRDNQVFIKEALGLYQQGVRLIFCHAEFAGSQYENGFYAPHGIDLMEMPSDLLFISGHIHKQQEFGNVWYPGTPRQLTRSDVGQTKGVWIISAATGVLSRNFIPTPENVCVPFKQITITPDTKEIPGIPESDRVYVDIQGPKEFIDKMLKKIPNQAKIRTFPDQEKPVHGISESDGIPVAFLKYAAKYAADKQLPPEVAKAVMDKIYHKCPMLKMGGR